MKEKTYNLKITEKELKNPVIKKHLLALVEMRLKLRKHQAHIIVSKVEFEFIKNHYSWTPFKMYKKSIKKADIIKGEVGKYNGKRVVVRGLK